MKEHTLIFLLSKLGEMSSDEIISFDGVLLRASNSLIAKIDEFKGELKHNNWSTSSVGNIFSNIFKNDDSVMMEDLVGIPHVKTNDILYISDKDIYKLLPNYNNSLDQIEELIDEINIRLS